MKPKIERRQKSNPNADALHTLKAGLIVLVIVVVTMWIGGGFRYEF